MFVAALSVFVGAAGALALAAPAATASSSQITTYAATVTIPVPPASNYAGAGGGDGWAVALTSTAVYNVFHHSGTLNVACHLQKDASPCFAGAVKLITDGSGHNFSTSGQPGLFLDQGNGHLFVYATRANDATAGVVCIDTTKSATFCGFTALTSVGAAPFGSWSGITNPVTVGTKWYAFNSVQGFGVGNDKNVMMCFDQATLKACSGQPFAVKVGSGTVTSGTSPSTPIGAIGNQIIVPISTSGHGAALACFNPTVAGGTCGGSWPATAPAGYVNSHGAPFPLLTKAGAITGFCVPDGTDECFGLDGHSVGTPPHLATTVNASYVWNGTAVVIGPRVFVPTGNTDAVQCYDYSASASCAGYPKHFVNLGLLYTVNPDPARSTCLWVNSDDGTQQIQNFDAFNPAQSCGKGPIRVLASSVVVPQEVCTPTTYTSLQVTDPARSKYTSGSVEFADAAGNEIPGIPKQPLDNTGTASLAGLNLNTATGLPQFLVTLTGAATQTSSVTVKLVWTATYDPVCVQGTTTAVVPTNTTVTTAAAPTTVVAELPRTGSANGGIALIGVSALGLGIALSLVRRRGSRTA